MIRVKARKKAGSVVSFHISGHSGFAEKGKDIVCAGVSAITQTAVIGLKAHLSVQPQVNRRRGRMDVVLPPLDTKDAVKADLILSTMLLGLTSLQAGYPGYVQLETQEV
jgi:uncharacterized protein YsxB (DUF464 family)